jgi:Rap1a immunity proteins
MRILLILLILVVPVSARAHDNVMTARNLLKVCTTASMHWVDFCNGFLQATHDQAAEAGKACVPNGVTRTGIVELYERVASELLRTNPSQGDRTAVSLGVDILKKAYPCR